MVDNTISGSISSHNDPYGNWMTINKKVAVYIDSILDITLRPRILGNRHRIVQYFVYLFHQRGAHMVVVFIHSRPDFADIEVETCRRNAYLMQRTSASDFAILDTDSVRNGLGIRRGGVLEGEFAVELFDGSGYNGISSSELMRGFGRRAGGCVGSIRHMISFCFFIYVSFANSNQYITVCKFADSENWPQIAPKQ